MVGILVMLVPLLAGCLAPDSAPAVPDERLSRAAGDEKCVEAAEPDKVLEASRAERSFSSTAAAGWDFYGSGWPPELSTGCDPHNLTATLTWTTDGVDGDWVLVLYDCMQGNPRTEGRSPLTIHGKADQLVANQECWAWPHARVGSTATGVFEFHYEITIYNRVAANETASQ